MDLNFIKDILSAEGLAEIKEEIADKKQKFGNEWLDAFKAEYGDLSAIIDLVANNGEYDAFLKTKQYISEFVHKQKLGIVQREISLKVALTTFELLQNNFFALHRLLKFELEKPRNKGV